MQPYIYGIIGGAVVFFLNLMLLAAKRGQAKADPETGQLVFRHSMLFRGFAYFSAFVIPIGITILVLFQPPKNDRDVYAIIGIYALFAVLSIPLLWESIRFSLAVSPEGLACRSPWRGQLFIAWDDVEEVSYSLINCWFILRATNGEKIRVHLFVAGLNQFLEACETYLPPKKFDKARPGYRSIGRPFPGEAK
jgi:hypothetical protein